MNTATTASSAITMHSASVLALTRGLNNMLAWLDKAQAHADARKFESGNFLGLRLAPDMLPFSRQIQIATDVAKGCVSRLAGMEIPKWEDNEASLDDLRARLRKAASYVQGFTPEQIEPSAGRAIAIPMRSGDALNFSGESFLRQWALPNFYFHSTAAYMLLRHNGVELGKADYLGQ